jgi:predicted ArsR family transcriptional regulator
VARLLLELGPSTAASLGERLGLSPAAIRRHLDAMLADGTITTRQARSYGRRSRGRPARLYELTDAGHAAGPTGYEELAASALQYLGDIAGLDAVEAFAAARAGDLDRQVRAVIGDVDERQRPAAVAVALSASGYAATASVVPTGVQLCQHHCPVQHVAERFPQLCDAETAALAAVLGSHVQRLATIAHGDGVCTTHIPSHIPSHVPADALSADALSADALPAGTAPGGTPPADARPGGAPPAGGPPDGAADAATSPLPSERAPA